MLNNEWRQPECVGKIDLGVESFSLRFSFTSKIQVNYNPTYFCILFVFKQIISIFITIHAFRIHQWSLFASNRAPSSMNIAFVLSTAKYLMHTNCKILHTQKNLELHLQIYTWYLMFMQKISTLNCWCINKYIPNSLVNTLW